MHRRHSSKFFDKKISRAVDSTQHELIDEVGRHKAPEGSRSTRSVEARRTHDKAGRPPPKPAPTRRTYAFSNIPSPTAYSLPPPAIIWFLGSVHMEERSPEDAELAELLNAAFAELVLRIGAEGRSQVKDGARYFVILDTDRSPVGCAALQVFGPDTAHPGDGELKRMYVTPAARGRGYARALLKMLEDTARAAGHPVLRLSTSEHQPEAIALYESSGYLRTAPWGKYINQPLTHCYEKVL
jgi:GNAT superfamily N-acetyltransferase